ncbi:MAG: trypsin-like peptidase domain-containing protein, partial [Bryobacterales bacterium]|nr:trypsin-like peptidase domain-containing protein [Bryobacterales bacterium]
MTAEEKQQRLKRYSQSITKNNNNRETAFEAFGAGPGQLAEWVDASEANEEERAAAYSGLRKLSVDQPLTPREMATLEAIILPTGRPVLTISNGTYPDPPAPWTKLGEEPYRRRLQAALPAIGRVEIPEHPSIPYAGTGFLVGHGLMMTNRHVAELFVVGLGRGELQFRSDVDSAGIDFRRELDSPASEFFAIKKILMVHPYWDMALFEIEGLSASREPLTLEAIPAGDLAGAEIAVVGYPAQDPRNDLDLQTRIFGGKYRVKRLQPGQVRGARETRSFGHPVAAMTHDSSTLGGNSGSALINVETGRVVGLHFGGVYLDANFAVPAYELSCDRYVVDASVNFTESNAGQAAWMNYWENERGTSVADNKTAPVALAGSVEITVPLKLTLSFGTPVVGGAPTITVTPDVEAQPYYDEAKDKQARTKYYAGVNPGLSPSKLFDALNVLLEQTHKTRPGYSPSKWVYPVV